VIGSFKSIIATEWLKWPRQNSPHCDGRVWQRNYYERVIRDEHELNRIREYISDNPLKWEYDRENPHRIPDRQYEEAWNWLEGEMRQAAVPRQLIRRRSENLE
jgi:hypothetical protein